MMSSELTVIDEQAPSNLVIVVKTNKALQNNKSGDGYLLKTDLTKEDIISIQLDGQLEIQLDGQLEGTNLKDLSPQELKNTIKDTPYLKAQAYSTSTFSTYVNPEKDDVNFKAKIKEVIDYVTTEKDNIKSLKKGDIILIDDFLSKNRDKYGNLEKYPGITSEIILKSPEKIDYLAGKTETAIVKKLGMSGAEKDADDLLGFLKAVVESRTKFYTFLYELKRLANDDGDKTIRKASSKIINFIDNKTTIGNGKVTDERYKYYVSEEDEGSIIKETYQVSDIKKTEYVGFNPDNSEYKAAADDKDSQKLIVLMNKYASEFDKNVRQILKKPIKGGRKSRKLSKGGRKRKTRSNKFA